MRYLKYIFLFIVMQCAGCKKFTEVAPPKTSVVASEAFNTDDGATSAVLGIYAKMLIYADCFTNGALTIYTGSSADELIPNDIGGTGAQGIQFYNNQILVKNPDVAAIWSNAYSIIAQANICINGINDSKQLTPSLKIQLLGEARFSRALIYFYLVNTFGDVPLVLDINWENNRQLGRTATATVYDQVIQDLQFASDNLTVDYLTGEKVRPNKYAAEALLARVYLYNHNWAKAAEQASLVIEPGVYSLDDLDNVFLKNSNEAIFQLRSYDSQGKNTDEGALLVPFPGSNPAYRINPLLLNDFEPGDTRKSHWIKSTIVHGESINFPFKYKLGNDYSNAPVREYAMIIRLVELYLIRAEALAMNGDLAGAVNDLNIIRDRSRDVPSPDVPDPLPALSVVSLSKADVLAAVMHERRTELFAEGGHRWFDLKRTGQADVVLGAVKQQWTSTAQLYPIPNQEIILAPNLKQNEGY